MILLPNGCSCSTPSVFPKSWNQVTASIKNDWYIQYYFRDPGYLEKFPNGKLVIIKGMNKLKNIIDRRSITKALLENELSKLKAGYNPIIGQTIVHEIKEGDILPETPFISALRHTWGKLTCVKNTKTDIKSTIKYIELSAMKLGYNNLPIKEIRRKHIKRILENCAETKKKWSANTFNAYRKNLGILFKELVEIEAIETNVIRDLSKQKTVRKIKRVLTPEECAKVSNWVKNYDHRFWLLIHIFFHSGCRTTELFRVKAKHINLDQQKAMFTVLKGNQPFEVEKPIKNIALEFWEEALKGAKEEDYIFGKGLMPSKIPINSKQVSRRWKRHIKGDKEKGKLGLTCDWYSLKHLNTDQITKEKGLKTAGLLNSHTNESTTKIYAIGQDSREFEDLKEMKNKFA